MHNLKEVRKFMENHTPWFSCCWCSELKEWGAKSIWNFQHMQVQELLAGMHSQWSNIRGSIKRPFQSGVWNKKKSPPPQNIQQLLCDFMPDRFLRELDIACHLMVCCVCQWPICGYQWDRMATDRMATCGRLSSHTFTAHECPSLPPPSQTPFPFRAHWTLSGMG